MLGLFYPYGFLLQAIAILHFVRRRPDTYWLWIILMGGALGALVYIAIEVVPDAGLLRGAFQVFPRRKRIKELEAAILDNPSVGNYEELGDLYLDDLQYARGRECYDRVLARSDSIDALYRRGLCEIALDDYTAAATDLQQSPSVTRSTTISAPPASTPTLLRRSASAQGRTHSLRRSRRRRRCRKPNTTTAASSLRRGAPRRLENGPSASCARRRRCRTTSAGVSAPGSGRRRRCSRSSREPSEVSRRRADLSLPARHRHADPTADRLHTEVDCPGSISESREGPRCDSCDTFWC